MKTSRGSWVTVANKVDSRVSGILSRMSAFAQELHAGLKDAGVQLRRAEQVVQLDGDDGARHSVDLVLVLDGEVIFTEVKWSRDSVATARAWAKKSLPWLRRAALGCTLVYPSRVTRRGSADYVAVLAVSPTQWSLEVEDSVAKGANFSKDSKCQQTESRRVRKGPSGSAKRSRNERLAEAEQRYRKGRGKDKHRRYARESMQKRRLRAQS